MAGRMNATPTQILNALRKAEAGTPVRETFLCIGKTVSTNEVTEIGGRSKREAISKLLTTLGHEIAEFVIQTFGCSEIGLKGLTAFGAVRREGVLRRCKGEAV